MARERRSSFRAPAVGRPQYELVVGKTRLPVEVLDQSAGGMLIASRQRPGVSAGDVVELCSPDHRVQVRVAHVQRRGLGARIGVERVSEASVNAHGELEQEGPTQPRRKWSRAVGIVLGVMAVLGSVGAIILWQSPAARAELQRVAAVVWGGDNHALPPLPALPREVKQKLRAHRGVDAFALPEVIEKLQLSEEQQATIAEITAKAKLTATQLGPNVDTTSAEYKKIFTQAQVEAVAVLTSSQRLQLELLLERSISPTELLQRVARQYWPRADARELYSKLGAAAVTLPQVADELRLTAEQRLRINQLVDNALDASEEIYQQSRASTESKPMPDHTKAMLEDVSQLVLHELTAEQRARLAPVEPSEPSESGESPQL